MLTSRCQKYMKNTEPLSTQKFITNSFDACYIVYVCCSDFLVIPRTIDSYWRDAKVIGNFAFIVSEAIDHGLQVREKKMHNLIEIKEYIAQLITVIMSF